MLVWEGVTLMHAALKMLIDVHGHPLPPVTRNCGTPYVSASVSQTFLFLRPKYCFYGQHAASKVR